MQPAPDGQDISGTACLPSLAALDLGQLLKIDTYKRLYIRDC